MKQESLIKQDWDDLVFENRNRAYGAYVLRKSYADGLFKGTMSGIGILTLLFLVPVFIGWISGDHIHRIKPGVEKSRVVQLAPRIDGKITIQKSSGQSLEESAFRLFHAYDCTYVRPDAWDAKSFTGTGQNGATHKF